MNPLVSAVEAHFKETSDDLPYYCRIALGTYLLRLILYYWILDIICYVALCDEA